MRGPRLSTSCRRAIVVTLAIGVAACGPAGLAANVSVARAAAADLADRLLAATTEEAAAPLVLDALERLGIGTYDAVGTPVRVGNEVGEDDLWFLDVEVEALAAAFVARQWVPLDAIAAALRDAGLQVDEGRGRRAITGGAVERALRRVRADVERARDHPQALLILIVDALGDRAEFPFSLLDEEESEPAFAAPGADAASAMMRAMFEQALRDAVADQDPDASEMLEKLLADGEAFEGLVEAMMRGDIGAVLARLAGEEAVRELGDAQRELRDALAAEDLEPETRAMLEASEALVGSLAAPGDAGALRVAEQSVESLRAIVAAREAALGAQVAAWEADLLARTGPRADARALYDAFIDHAGQVPALAWQVHELAGLAAFVEDMAVETEVHRAVHAAPDVEPPTGGLPWEEDADGSELLLDPLQAMLVVIDLLVEPRDPGARRLAPHPAASPTDAGSLGGGFDAAAVWAQASTDGRCGGIGAFAAAHPDGFGAVERLLSTTRTLAGALQELDPSGAAKATAKQLAMAILDWLTMQVEVRVAYPPGEPSSILRPHHRDDDRRVMLHVRAVDTLADRLPGRLRDLAQTAGEHARVCGFLKDVAGDLGLPGTLAAGLLDALERVTDGRDLEDLPVIVDLGGDAWTHLHVDPSDWGARYGANPMRVQARTDADGRVSGPLWPRLVSPDVGGRLTTHRVPVRVQLVLTETPQALFRASRLVPRMAEELLRPVQRWVHVGVDVYEPLPIRGALTVSRTVSEEGSTEATVDDVLSKVVRTGTYVLEMRVDDAVVVGGAGVASALPSFGLATVAGGARLTASLHYRVNALETSEWMGACDGAPSLFVERVELVADVLASGRMNVPPPRLAVQSQREMFVVQPGAPMAALGAALAMGEATGTRSLTTTLTACGSTTVVREEEPDLLEERVLRVLFGPVAASGDHVRPWSRAAPRLIDEVSWAERIPDAAMEQWAAQTGGRGYPTRFEVSTTIAWDLARGE